MMIEELAPTAVAVGGLTLGADPLATATSVLGFQAGKPRATFIVRKEPKGHGTNQWVESTKLAAGAPVVILEDVVTTGASTLARDRALAARRLHSASRDRPRRSASRAAARRSPPRPRSPRCSRSATFSADMKSIVARHRARARRVVAAAGQVRLDEGWPAQPPDYDDTTSRVDAPHDAARRVPGSARARRDVQVARLARRARRARRRTSRPRRSGARRRASRRRRPRWPGRTRSSSWSRRGIVARTTSIAARRACGTSCSSTSRATRSSRLEIVKDKRPGYVLHAEFPAFGDFATAYVARFPRTQPRARCERALGAAAHEQRARRRRSDLGRAVARLRLLLATEHAIPELRRLVALVEIVERFELGHRVGVVRVRALKNASSSCVNSTASLRTSLISISFDDDAASPFDGTDATFAVAAAIAACAAARSETKESLTR